MSDEDKNVAILRNAYEKWNATKGDSINDWLAIMDESMDFRSLAEGAKGLEFTARRRSREEVIGYLQGLVEAFEMIHYKVDEYVAQGDRVVAIGSTAWKCRATGKEFDTPKVDVWRFKDGRAVGFFEFYDTAMVQAATAE